MIWSAAFCAPCTARGRHSRLRRPSFPHLCNVSVVLVHQENARRSRWTAVVIERLIVGWDEKVTGARVKMLVKRKPVYIERPVQKLYLLDVSA